MFSLSFFLPMAFACISAAILFLWTKKGLSKKLAFVSQIASTGIVSFGIFVFDAFRVIRADEVVSVLSGKEISVGFALGLIAAAFALGLSALATGITFSAAIPAAIAAMSENEKTFGKSLVLAIIAETLAIYGLLVSILILNKLA